MSQPTTLPTQVEFISAGQLPEREDVVDFEVLTREDWEGDLETLASTPGHQVAVPRSADLKRVQVVNAFIDAFGLIGGVPRFALWADENETEFYKLWSKLAPRQVEAEVQHDGGLTIQHVLPRGKLDV